MSFDVNVLSSKPVIKAAANMQNDGGGGNLGYMFQGRKKSKEHRTNIFAQEPEVDTFSVRDDLELPDEKFDIAKWIANIIMKIKSLWK